MAARILIGSCFLVNMLTVASISPHTKKEVLDYCKQVSRNFRKVFFYQELSRTKGKLGDAWMWLLKIAQRGLGEHHHPELWSCFPTISMNCLLVCSKDNTSVSFQKQNVVFSLHVRAACSLISDVVHVTQAEILSNGDQVFELLAEPIMCLQGVQLTSCARILSLPLEGQRSASTDMLKTLNPQCISPPTPHPLFFACRSVDKTTPPSYILSRCAPVAFF